MYAVMLVYGSDWTDTWYVYHYILYIKHIYDVTIFLLCFTSHRRKNNTLNCKTVLHNDICKREIHL